MASSQDGSERSHGSTRIPQKQLRCRFWVKQVFSSFALYYPYGGTILEEEEEKEEEDRWGG